MERQHVTVPTRLSRAEAADYLGLTKSTLDGWACHGKGPRFCKIGGKVTYLVEELEAWLQTRMTNRSADLIGK